MRLHYFACLCQCMISTCHTCAIALLCLSLPMRDFNLPYLCDCITLACLCQCVISTFYTLVMALLYLPCLRGSLRQSVSIDSCDLTALDPSPSFAPLELCGWNSPLLLCVCACFFYLLVSCIPLRVHSSSRTRGASLGG